MDNEGRVLVEATVVSIGEGPYYYPACQQCYSKLVNSSRLSGILSCSRCKINYRESEVSQRYRMCLTICDRRTLASITTFGQMLSPFFGCSATDLHEKWMGPLNEACFPQVQVSFVIRCALEKTMVGHSLLFGFKGAIRKPKGSRIFLKDITDSMKSSTTAQYPAWKRDLIAVQILPQNPALAPVPVTHHLARVNELIQNKGENFSYNNEMMMMKSNSKSFVKDILYKPSQTNLGQAGGDLSLEGEVDDAGTGNKESFDQRCLISTLVENTSIDFTMSGSTPSVLSLSSLQVSNRAAAEVKEKCLLSPVSGKRQHKSNVNVTPVSSQNSSWCVRRWQRNCHVYTDNLAINVSKTPKKWFNKPHMAHIKYSNKKKRNPSISFSKPNLVNGDMSPHKFIDSSEIHNSLKITAGSDYCNVSVVDSKFVTVRQTHKKYLTLKENNEKDLQCKTRPNDANYVNSSTVVENNDVGSSSLSNMPESEDFDLFLACANLEGLNIGPSKCDMMIPTKGDLVQKIDDYIADYNNCTMMSSTASQGGQQFLISVAENEYLKCDMGGGKKFLEGSGIGNENNRLVPCFDSIMETEDNSLFLSRTNKKYKKPECKSSLERRGNFAKTTSNFATTNTTNDKQSHPDSPDFFHDDNDHDKSVSVRTEEFHNGSLEDKGLDLDCNLTNKELPESEELDLFLSIGGVMSSVRTEEFHNGSLEDKGLDLDCNLTNKELPESEELDLFLSIGGVMSSVRTEEFHDGNLEDKGLDLDYNLTNKDLPESEDLDLFLRIGGDMSTFFSPDSDVHLLKNARETVSESCEASQIEVERHSTSTITSEKELDQRFQNIPAPCSFKVIDQNFNHIVDLSKNVSVMAFDCIFSPELQSEICDFKDEKIKSHFHISPPLTLKKIPKSCSKVVKKRDKTLCQVLCNDVNECSPCSSNDDCFNASCDLFSSPAMSSSCSSICDVSHKEKDVTSIVSSSSDLLFPSPPYSSSRQKKFHFERRNSQEHSKGQIYPLIDSQSYPCQFQSVLSASEDNVSVALFSQDDFHYPATPFHKRFDREKEKQPQSPHPETRDCYSPDLFSP